MNKTRLVFLFYLLCFGFISQAQNEHHSNLVPPSPNAASLGKYVDVPVGLYTGIPSITIPLSAIQAGDIQVPISLSYHASGLKVNEVASSTGFGWSLSAGGTLSRTIRGGADNSGYGYFTARAGEVFGNMSSISLGNPFPVINGAQNPPTNGNYCAFIRDWMGGCIDTEPDMYFVSAPGLSHKFMFDREGNYHLFPYDTIRMTHPFEGLSGDWIPPSNGLKDATWTVIGKNGIQYVFGEGKSEKTTSAQGNDQLSHCQSNVDNYTTWNLSKIISSSGLDTVYFYYETEFISYQSFSETFYSNDEGGYPIVSHLVPPTQNHQFLTAHQNRLRKIVASSGQMVEFIYDNKKRKDLNGGHRLQEVLVYFKNRLQKRFVLEHTYYEKLDLLPFQHVPPTASGHKDKRLCLESLQEYNANGETLPPYTFEYKKDGSFLRFPAHLSRSEDYWGFYGDNPSLGVLEKISYPTGGEAKFLFENNDFSGLIKTAYEETSHHKLCSFLFPEGDSHGRKEFTFNITPNTTGTDTVQVDYKTVSSHSNYQLAGHHAFYAKLYKINGGAEIFVQDVIYPQGRLRLLPGEYKLKMRMKDYQHGDPIDEVSNFSDFPSGELLPELGFSSSDYLETYFEWTNQGDTTDVVEGGGIRIKRTEMRGNPNGEADFTKYYDYRESSTGLSSGRLKSEYGHKYTKWAFKIGYLGLSMAAIVEAIVDLDIQTNDSPIPMGMVQGSYVGHGEVSVLHGRKRGNIILPPNTPFKPTYFYGNGGKEVHTFTNIAGSKNYFYSQFPAVPHDIDEYKYGLPLTTSHYKYLGDDTEGLGIYRKIQEERNTYSPVITKGRVDGVKGAWSEFRPDNVSDPLSPLAFCPLRPTYSGYSGESHRIKYQVYSQYSEYIQKTKTESFFYDEHGQTMLTETNYTYHPDNLLPTRTEQITNHGGKIVTELYYPIDFDNMPTTGDYVANYEAIQKMKDKHIISPVILQKVRTYKPKNSGGLEWLSGEITGIQTTAFKVENMEYEPGKFIEVILPHKVFSFQSQTPVANSSFDVTMPYESSLLKEEFRYLEHNTRGKLLSFEKINDLSKSYIWSYGGDFPIAEVVNASADEIAYTSFEEGTLETNSTGNWTSPEFAYSEQTRTVDLLNQGSGTNNYILDVDITHPQVLKIAYTLNTSTGTTSAYPIIQVEDASGTIVAEKVLNNVPLEGNIYFDIDRGDDYKVNFRYEGTTVYETTSSIQVDYLQRIFINAGAYTVYEDAKTGYLSANCELKKTGLKAGTYQVSFWTKKVGGGASVPSLTLTSTGDGQITQSYGSASVSDTWEYKEFLLEVNTNTDLTLSPATGVQLDELRLAPVDAQINTYTYTPDFQVYQVIDNNNQLVEFVYDAFKRLFLKKDFEGNIIEKTEYHYKNN